MNSLSSWYLTLSSHFQFTFLFCLLWWKFDFFYQGWEFGGKDGKVGESWWIYFLQRILFPSIWGFQEENQSHTLPGTKVLHPGKKMILFLFTNLLCYYAFCCLFDISEKNIAKIHFLTWFFSIHNLFLNLSLGTIPRRKARWKRIILFFL